MADKSNVDRRQFLQATAAVAISLPVLDALAADTPASAPGPINVGLLKDFGKDAILDQWARSNRIFVIVHMGKLFAPSATCTHKGCVLRVNSPTDLYCKCHRSDFTIDGEPTAGPAHTPLPRYSVSVSSDGRVMVDKRRSFDEAHWADPASFIEVGK